MIPRTTARRLETTLVSYSRQSLPRPARFYSTPTKKANAPAYAQATLPPNDFVSYSPETAVSRDTPQNLQGFLGRRRQYTLLPTPLPDDKSSALNDFYFPDSPTQDQLAVIDACLHNLYDVHRARQVFEHMRETKPGDAILESRVFNSFIEAYVNMASTKGKDDAEYWIRSAWELYDVMEQGIERVVPNAATYASILTAWTRFGPQSDARVNYEPGSNLKDVLFHLLDRGVSLKDVVASRVLTSDEEASKIIQTVSKAAAELGMIDVVSELGEAQAMGSIVDPLDNVPDVDPVLKAKVQSPSELEAGEAPREPTMEVPFNLDVLRKHLANVRLARRVLPEDVTARQVLLEASVHEVASERFKHEDAMFKQLGLKDSLHERNLQAWMWNWHQVLTERLQVTIKDLIKAEVNPKQREYVLGPFLSLVKADKLSLITILELMRLHGSGGVTDGMKTARALLAVGKAVEGEYKAQMCRKNKIQVPNQTKATEHSFFSHFGYRDLHARRVAAAKYMEDAEEWTSDWSQKLRVKVGSILVDNLMDVATVERTAINRRTGETVTEDHPAFFHSYEYVRGQKLGVIKLNQEIATRMAKDGLRETLHPRHLPMLVKPKPWLSDDDGGYLNNKTSAMRFKDSQEQKAYLRHASQAGNVELVYAGLDVLGSTPWHINRQIFDVVIEVWNSGRRFSKMPPAQFDEPEPEKPDNYDNDMQAKSVHGQRLKAYQQDKANNHSDRCSVNYKIEIARAFLGDTLYLPHNLDFRGRAYPIPPHLNHLGDDLSRGLLKFAESKPLGARGLRWLKIHLANLYGYDKGNFDEREQFVMEHLDDVYNSAEKPLDGQQWWTKADDPWQCLATCMELRAALESPNPLEFESSLPVHQDGTCNGLQHYAALGGDAQGARQVNLSVTDRPSDVYTFVAEMVERQIDLDISKGDKYAKMLTGKISRKVVKQTVMTTVYGVTYIGARDQIEKQLKDRKDIPEEECWSAASYLAKKVLACIGDIFSGAKGIQIWLNLCARIISKSIPSDRIAEALEAQARGKSRKPVPENRLKKEQMTSVVWTTPLGLPIVQPYRKTKRKQIMTALQTVFISDPNSPAEVNSVKQASAFPPNFIHSLDATHMMLTALECRTQNLTFASVHDSYWTHASTIDNMSEIIRDTFIALHSSDVLGKLDFEMRERYKGYKVALAHLRNGGLIKNLVDAGCRITATPEQASRLGLAHSELKAILTISDSTESSIDEKDVDTATLEAIASETLPKSGRSKKAVSADDLPSTAESTGAHSESVDDMDKLLLGKFVDLTDIIPPLPEKGSFDVADIRKSQYFFS